MTDARALAQDAEIIADALTNLTYAIQQLARRLGAGETATPGAQLAAPVEYNPNGAARVFIAKNSPDWPAYAAGYRTANGKNPPLMQGPNHAPTFGWYFFRDKPAKD